MGSAVLSRKPAKFCSIEDEVILKYNVEEIPKVYL